MAGPPPRGPPPAGTAHRRRRPGHARARAPRGRWRAGSGAAAAALAAAGAALAAAFAGGPRAPAAQRRPPPPAGAEGAGSAAGTARGASAAAGEARRARAGAGRAARSALSDGEVAKLDGTPDELFYLLPRIGVQHTDDNFRRQLTQLYRLLLPAGGDVLDLCSQHDSHLPPEVTYGSLSVHGMNYLELLSNGRADNRFVRNFNSDPSLSNLADGSMDAVLMAASIQYMQRPVELLRDVRRVLRPGGVVIVSFSNRMFFTKAIEAWRSQKSMRGLAMLVQGYLREAGLDGVRAANGVRVPAAGEEEGFLRGVLPQFASDPFLAAVGYRADGVSGAAPAADAVAAAGEGVSWLATEGRGSIW